jgi:peptide deformylase
MTKVLTIARMGEPILNKIALPVDLPSEYEETKQLIADMITTLNDGGKKTGLAAPQVFVSKRVVIFRISKTSKSLYNDQITEEIPLTVLINPVITPQSDVIVDGLEACLSIPGLMGVVPRYRDIEYSYVNIEGERFVTKASGFHARVVQHECDHLDGILYHKKIADLSKFSFVDLMQRA